MRKKQNVSYGVVVDGVINLEQVLHYENQAQLLKFRVAKWYDL